MAEIMNRLKGKRNIRFRDLFSGDWPLSELIVTFLALLELVKTGSISIFQGKEGSDIKLEALK